MGETDEGERDRVDLLVKNADYLISMNGDRQIIRDGALAINGGAITAVGKTADVMSQYPEATRVIDASGHLLTPGFIDNHQHLTPFFLRGLGDDIPLKVFLHDRLYPLEAAITEEEAYVSSACALLESIRHGTTTVCDPGSQSPEPSVQAVEDLGCRAVLTRSLTDMVGGRAMPGTFDSSTDDAIAAGVAFVEAHQGAGSGRVRPWFSLRTERMVSDRLCAAIAELAKEYNTGIVSHMISNRDSVEHHQLVFDGERPIERYERNGVLGPNLQLVHCHFLEEDECDLLAERDVKVSMCPTASAVFGWGGLHRATHLKLLDRGVTVGVGTDIGACSHTTDILRIAQYFRVYRDVFEDSSLMPAETILEHLTIDGARSILWDDDIGSLEVGKRADFLLFDLDRPEWVPLHNPISNLCHGASGDSIDTVVIDGTVIVQKGEFVNIDARELMQRGRELAGQVAARTGLDAFAAPRWPVI